VIVGDIEGHARGRDMGGVDEFCHHRGTAIKAVDCEAIGGSYPQETVLLNSETGISPSIFTGS
jgi:hypothetical protein